MDYVKSKIRDIVDFPTEGVVFKDLTTAFKDPRALYEIGEALHNLYKDRHITKVVGIESRGFIGATMLAYSTSAGFVPARKPGKLPAKTISASFEKEYGKDIIEIHQDSISDDDVVVIHDDVLATGGTLKCAYDLVKSLNPKKIYLNTIVEISGLEGRIFLPTNVEYTTLITF